MATDISLLVQATALFVALFGATVAVRVTVFPLRSVAVVLLSVTPVTATGLFTVTLQVAFLLPSLVVTVIVAVHALTALTTPF